MFWLKKEKEEGNLKYDDEIKSEWQPDGNTIEEDELTSHKDEAGVHNPTLVYHWILHGYNKINVTSNDSDRFALVVFFSSRFLHKGLIGLTEVTICAL